MSTEIKTAIKVVNGRAVVDKNWRRLRAVSERLCTNVRHSKIDPLTYKESFHVVKGRGIYAFVEVTHGMGGGTGRTLREAVIKACRFYRVVIEDSEVELLPRPDWFDYAEKEARDERARRRKGGAK